MLLLSLLVMHFSLAFPTALKTEPAIQTKIVHPPIMEQMPGFPDSDDENAYPEDMDGDPWVSYRYESNGLRSTSLTSADNSESYESHSKSFGSAPGREISDSSYGASPADEDLQGTKYIKPISNKFGKAAKFKVWSPTELKSTMNVSVSTSSPTLLPASQSSGYYDFKTFLIYLERAIKSGIDWKTAINNQPSNPTGSTFGKSKESDPSFTMLMDSFEAEVHKGQGWKKALDHAYKARAEKLGIPRNNKLPRAPINSTTEFEAELRKGFDWSDGAYGASRAQIDASEVRVLDDIQAQIRQGSSWDKAFPVALKRLQREKIPAANAENVPFAPAVPLGPLSDSTNTRKT